MARKINFISKSYRSRYHQKGMALIFFAFLLGLVVTGFGIKLLSGGSVQIQQSVKSTQALAEAKAAVIGSVISGQSGASFGIFPCSEDTLSIGSPNEGQATSSCNSTSIGRFAWRTMGAGDLRDGNNDKLWYALSAGFRGVPINSDTIGQLSLDGVQNQAIAILFSPGTLLSGQSRPTPTSSSPPVVSSYLETENSDGDGDFITGASTTTFNDKLLTIKADDVFPALEKRVLGEFKNYLNAYKAVWGAFPFPAAFGDPENTATYVGNSALSGGFLPISNTSPTTAWNTSTTPTPVVFWPAGNSGSNPACTFRTNTVGMYLNGRIRCEITITSYNSSNPPVFSITGVVNDIGLNFYDGFTDISRTTSNDVRVTTRSGTATVASTSRAVTHGFINTSGDATVTFTGVLANTGIVRIEFRRTPQLSQWVLAATPNKYLIDNNWHHLVYYKVATPFLPGGSATCGTICLTVNAINVTPNTILSGNHALLMSAGRKLDITNARPSPTYSAANPAQTTRPGSMLEDYFDSANNTNLANSTNLGLVFDSTNRPLATFNDQVQIVE